MELKTKYMICFVDHNMLQTDEADRFALSATFQESATYETKLEALDHLRLFGTYCKENKNHVPSRGWLI